MLKSAPPEAKYFPLGEVQTEQILPNYKNKLYKKIKYLIIITTVITSYHSYLWLPYHFTINFIK